MFRLQESEIQELEAYGHCYLPADALNLLNKLINSWRRQLIQLQQLSQDAANTPSHTDKETLH